MQLLNSFTAISLLLLLNVLYIQASIHTYTGDKFTKKGNAFVIHGGSEGIYYSRTELNDSSVSSSNGNAYIR